MRFIIIKKILNIGVFAHVDAGKTTLTEHLLYETGAIRTMGRVDDGNTITDGMALEQKRGISIMSTPISLTYKDVKINLIDTPGHVEFVAEVERAMSILDGAILLVSAKEGVQSHTILLFESLKKLGVPIICFVNKMDRTGVDIDGLMEVMQSELSRGLIPIQDIFLEPDAIHIGDLYDSTRLIEECAMYDDNLMARYLDNEPIDIMEVKALVAKEVSQCKLFPVCFGSALNHIGVPQLLEAVVDLLPKVCLVPQGPPTGVVFKILRNKDNRREIYIRLYEGTLRSRGMIHDEKISFIKTMENGKLEYAKEAYGNDIVVILGPEKLRVGDVIGLPKAYTPVSLGVPTLRTRVESQDKKQLGEILDLLAESDPFLQYDIEAHSQDLYLSLFGEIQMEIIRDMVQERHGVELTFSDPVIIYKESPIGTGEFTMYMYRGDQPFAATVGIKVEPYDEGTVIHSDVSTGFLPQTFQNGIIDGIEGTLKEGLKGWEVTNIKVSIIEGAFNSVDSTPADFRNLTPMVLMEAIHRAQTKLLWPVNRFKVKVDQMTYGRVMSDLMMMKATEVETYDDQGKFLIVGKIPVETSLSYEKTFTAITSGKGLFSQVFYRYEEAPEFVDAVRSRNQVDPLNRGKYLLSKLGAY